MHVLRRDNQLEKRRVYLEENENENEDTVRAELQEKIDKFRDRFTHGKFSSDLDQITLQTHGLQHILTSCLMIPNGSTKPDHVELFVSSADSFL